VKRRAQPRQQGLYDPRFEHDACGIGFIVDMKGRVSHEFVEMGIEMLLNLNHRGACGCEENTGDGAGILLQTPHGFFERICADAGIPLPSRSRYGVGMIFLPDPAEARMECERLLEEVVREEGQELLGWRTVPVDNSLLGPTAKACQPVIRQVFIGARGAEPGQDLERKLYVIRRRVENRIRSSDIRRKEMFYVASLSSRTVVYKGMLRADQMTSFYPDLVEPSLETGLAMVHSRFSTNTFPNWNRAHPYRYLCHNGEINTLQGNCNWMRAREDLFESDLLGPDLAKILPVIDPDGSDSAMFDNALEMLYMTGRSLPHSMMMMIPEPWSGDPDMNPAKRAFYEYHSCLMEPWDGPASIAFTDGLRAGAVLDRNGLRPSRYSVTEDGMVVLASEVGVLDIRPRRFFARDAFSPAACSWWTRSRDESSRTASSSGRSRWPVPTTSGFGNISRPWNRFLTGGGLRPWTGRGCGVSSISSDTPTRTCGCSSLPWPRRGTKRWAPWVPTHPWLRSRTGPNFCTTISSSSSPK